MIGMVLAGGRASRIGGGDKGLRWVGGVFILDRVVATLRPHCTTLLINANGGAERFAHLDLPVVADAVAGQLGPLAGVLSGLEWAAHHAPGESFLVTAPTDAPFLPADLVTRLREAQADTGRPIVCARSGGRTHPVAALWSVALRDDLRRALTEEGLRKVGLFTDRHGAGTVDWPVAPHDPFFNVNSAEDLALAQTIAAGAS